MYVTKSHVLDTKYPGICQQLVNLSSCWNQSQLQDNAEEILDLWEENASWHTAARKYLAGAASLYSDICNISEGFLQKMRLHDFAFRFVKRHLPRRQAKFPDSPGRCYVKKLSAITPKGYVINKVPDNYQQILVCDNYFSASSFFMKLVADFSLIQGYDVVTSVSNLVQPGRIEHILIPDAKSESGKGLALIGADPHSEIMFSGVRRMNLSRFYDGDKLSERRQRLEFSRKAASSLKQEAIKSLQIAKQVHDELESYYIAATDFSLVDRVIQSITKEIATKLATERNR